MNFLKPFSVLAVLFIVISVHAQEVISNILSEGNSQRYVVANTPENDYLLVVDLLDSLHIYELMDGEALHKHSIYFLGLYTTWHYRVNGRWLLLESNEEGLAYDFVNNKAVAFPHSDLYDRSSWTGYDYGVSKLRQSDASNESERYFLLDEDMTVMSTDELYADLRLVREDYYVFVDYGPTESTYTKQMIATGDIAYTITVAKEARGWLTDHRLSYIDTMTNSVMLHDFDTEQTTTAHTWDFEPTRVIVDNEKHQLICAAMSNVDNTRKSFILDYMTGGELTFDDEYLSDSEVTSFAGGLVYRSAAFDSINVYSFVDESTYSLASNSWPDDAIIIGDRYVLYETVEFGTGPEYLRSVTAYDMIEKEVQTFDLRPYSTYRVSPTYSLQGGKCLLSYGIDAESADELVELDFGSGVGTVSDIVPHVQAGLPIESEVVGVGSDVFVTNREHIYAVQGDSLARLDVNAIIKNVHQTAQFDDKGMYWAERQGKIIRFFHFRDGQQEEVATITDPAVIGFNDFIVTEFIEGEKTVLAFGRAGLENKTVLVSKEDNSIIELESEQLHLLRLSFYHDGAYYFQEDNSLYRITEEGLLDTVELELQLLGYGNYYRYDGNLFLCNGSSIFALVDGQLQEQLSFGQQFFLPFFLETAGLLICYTDIHTYAYYGGSWITVSLTDEYYYKPLTEDLLLATKSTGTNQIKNELYSLTTQEYQPVALEIESLRLISAFQYQDKQMLITSDGLFGSYEVRVYETWDDFSEVELVASFDASGRGVQASFVEYGDEGLLYVGNRLFLMNDQLEFVELADIHGDHQSIAIVEAEGAFYFIALHPDLGRQLYRTVAFSQRVSTDQLPATYGRSYPNPTAEVVYFGMLESNILYTVTVTDAQGRLVLQQTVEGRQPLRVDDLEVGVYFAAIRGGAVEEGTVVPFVKQ